MSAALSKNLNAVALSVGKTLKTSSGSAVNIVICLVTVGSEQLFSFAAFNCPCPSIVTTKNNASERTEEGNPAGVIYGLVFIIVPAFILFLLGNAMNIKTWKLITGCRHRHLDVVRGYSAGCATLFEIFMQALVAPSTWISIAFLDGKYYACATSQKPYDMSCEAVVRASSSSVKYTVEFERNKQRSQVIGWVFITIILFLGSTVYLIYRCFSQLTYHHRHYMKWYRDTEHKQFEEIAKEQLKEQAAENIKNFLSSKRKKKEWDSISTVFTFKRDKEDYAIYSRLDDWCEEHPLLCETDEDDNGDTEENKKSSVNESILTAHTAPSHFDSSSADTGFASAEKIPLKTLHSAKTPQTNHNLPHRMHSNESITKYATCRSHSKQTTIMSNKTANQPKTLEDASSTNTNNSNSHTPLLLESSSKLKSTNC